MFLSFLLSCPDILVVVLFKLVPCHGNFIFKFQVKKIRKMTLRNMHTH